MQLLGGLGNPGPAYAENRHNIGFMLVDCIHQHYSFSTWRSRDGALVSDGRVETTRLILVKPQQFMNKSGLPLAALMRFYKIPLENLIIAHDELDLKAGKLRVKTAGGHGGHNGLRDLGRHLGDGYCRLRIGIGRPEHANADVSRWVLGDFSRTERGHWVEPLLRVMTDQLPLLLAGDCAGYATSIARLAPPPLPATSAQQDDSESDAANNKETN